MGSVSVIIPTYSNQKGFFDTLKSLKETSGKFELIIIDNSPSSEKKRFLFKLFPRALYLPQKKNLGFARAVNLGTSKAKGKYLAILNDDILLSSEWVEGLIVGMEGKGWIAAAPALKKPNGEVENLGYRVLPYGKVKLNFGPSDPIDGLSATCLLINRRTFLSVGGFDPDFFAYLEDVDLFLRLKKKGYKFGVVPEVEIVHLGQKTSQKMNNFKARMDVKNWFFVIVKNWPAEKILRHFPQIFIERLRNLSGLIKQTVWWQIPWTILVTYGECGLKIPKMVIKRLSGNT